jgi:hypothetical protein
MGLLFWGDRPIKEAHNNIITKLFYFILFLKITLGTPSQKAYLTINFLVAFTCNNLGRGRVFQKP